MQSLVPIKKCLMAQLDSFHTQMLVLNVLDFLSFKKTRQTDLVIFEEGEVSEGFCDAGVIGPQCVLIYLLGTLVQGQGQGVVTLETWGWV